jgi:hypothetical protein
MLATSHADAPPKKNPAEAGSSLGSTSSEGPVEPVSSLPTLTPGRWFRHARKYFWCPLRGLPWGPSPLWAFPGGPSPLWGLPWGPSCGLPWGFAWAFLEGRRATRRDRQSPPVAAALQRESPTIPIVFVNITDDNQLPVHQMGAFSFDNFDLKSIRTLLPQLDPKHRSRLL